MGPPAPSRSASTATSERSPSKGHYRTTSRLSSSSFHERTSRTRDAGTGTGGRDANPCSADWGVGDAIQNRGWTGRYGNRRARRQARLFGSGPDRDADVGSGRQQEGTDHRPFGADVPGL